MARFATLTLSPAWDRTLELSGPLVLDSVQQVCQQSCLPGGKGFNAARMLAACGVPVSATGLIGADAADAFRQACSIHGITPRFMEVQAPTRVNLMLTDHTHELKINTPPFPDLAFNPAWTDELIHLLCADGATHVIASGSLPRLFPENTYASLICRLAAVGIKTAIDTSGTPLSAALTASPWVIKPNRQETEQLLSRPLASQTYCETAALELATRSHYAILSDGPNGAWFATGSTLWHVPSPHATTIDTTAAGDILLARFCASLATEGFTPQAMATSVAAGAAATEQPGAALPAPERILELARTVTPLRIR